MAELRFLKPFVPYPVHIGSLGRWPHPARNQNATRRIANNLWGVEAFTTISPPSTRGDTGFQLIYSRPVAKVMLAEGCVISPGETVAIVSRDCPIVVITNGQRTAVFHAGRNALAPNPTCEACTYTVVSAAVAALCGSTSLLPPGYRAYVLGGIQPEHFPHDQNGGIETFVKPFWRKYGEVVPNVVPDTVRGTLNLYGVLTYLLFEKGVDCVITDTECPFSSPRMSSKRGNKGSPEEPNVFVVYHERQ